MLEKQSYILRDEVIKLLDLYFLEENFIRKKNSQSWKKKINQEISYSIGLNFGIYKDSISIIPNISVRHNSLEELLLKTGVISKKDTTRTTIGCLTTSLLNKSYDYINTNNAINIAQEIFDDIQKVQESFINLSNKQWIIKKFESSTSKDWLDSISMRARLIPLLYLVDNKIEEAIQTAKELTIELGEKDQMIPNIKQFNIELEKLIKNYK